MLHVLSIYIVIFFVTGLGFSSAWAETSCAQLNSLYIDKYVSDFSIDGGPEDFNIGASNPLFKCNGTDKNYILARAISDLDLFRPYQEGQTDFYDMLSMIYKFPGVSIRYVESLGNANGGAARIEANVESEPDGSITTLSLSKLYADNSKDYRLHASQLLVHEARHVIYKKTLPDGRVIPDEPRHVICSRGKHKGKNLRVCDETLTFDQQMAFGSGNSYEFLYLIFIRSHPLASAEIKKEASEHLRYLATHMFNNIEPGVLEHYDVKLIPKSQW